MMKQYKTKKIGDGLTMQTAFRPELYDLSPIGMKVIQEMATEYIVECDVTEDEHWGILSLGVVEYGN